MTQMSSFTCESCGSRKFNVKVTAWFAEILAPVMDLESLSKCGSDNADAIISQVAATMSSSSRDADLFASVKIPMAGTYPWIFLTCARCKDDSAKGATVDMSHRMLESLTKEVSRLEVSYVSSALDCDLRPIESIVANYNTWLETVEQTLRTSHPEQYEHIQRMRKLRNLFSPDRGGFGDFYSGLGFLLSTLASGLATNFLYDLIKAGVAKARGGLTRRGAGVQVREAIRRFSAIKDNTLLATPRDTNRYEEDILSIIASMPLAKRKRVVNEIAKQHASNVTKLLLRTLGDKKNGRNQRR